MRQDISIVLPHMEHFIIFTKREKVRMLRPMNDGRFSFVQKRQVTCLFGAFLLALNVGRFLCPKTACRLPIRPLGAPKWPMADPKQQTLHNRENSPIYGYIRGCRWIERAINTAERPASPLHNT